MNRRSFAGLIFAIALMVVPASYLLAQTGGPGAAGPGVSVVVTAEARKGAEVPMIHREDVMVFEGRDRDQVTNWLPAQGDNAALEYFIVIDDGSNANVGLQFDDIRKFINAQPATTKIGIAYIQNGTSQILQQLTADHELAAKALRLPMGIAAGDASPYFGITDLVKRWPPSAARHEVLLVSDGIDHYYQTPDLQNPYLNAAIEDAQRAGMIVSAIYSPGAGHAAHSFWQTNWGQIYLSELADRTGGESYYIGFTGPPVSFVPYLQDQETRLNHQYWLTFVPKPQKKAGMQKVKIRTEVSGVELVGPDQVYVPAQQ